MDVLAFVVSLYAVAVILARIEGSERGLLPGPHHGPSAFCALIALGLSACVAGMPYLADEMRGPVAILLGAALIASGLRSTRTGARLVCWVLPLLWLVGASDPSRYCFCANHAPRPAEFEALGVVLFVGAALLCRSLRAGGPIVLGCWLRLYDPSRAAHRGHLPVLPVR